MLKYQRLLQVVYATNMYVTVANAIHLLLSPYHMFTNFLLRFTNGHIYVQLKKSLKNFESPASPTHPNPPNGPRPHWVVSYNVYAVISQVTAGLQNTCNQLY